MLIVGELKQDTSHELKDQFYRKMASKKSTFNISLFKGFKKTPPFFLVNKGFFKFKMKKKHFCIYEKQYFILYKSMAPPT